MTNLKRALVTTLLITAIAAPSAGCAAARVASLASKFGKAARVVSLGGKATKVTAVGKATKVVAAGRGAGLAKVLQSPQVRVLHHVGDVDKFVPDEVADAFIVTAEDEAGYASLYGRPPTYAELSSLKSGVSPIASTTGESQEVSRTGGGIKDFVAYLDESPSKNIIVIGHNQGGSFYFANGESMPLAKMARLIDARNKRGIFLSCEAKKYLPKGHPASTTKLTRDDALDILDDLSEKLRDEAARIGHQADDIASASEDSQLLGEHHAPDKLLDIRDKRVSELIQGTINSAERRVAVNRTVKRVAKAGAGGGFAYYVVKLTGMREARKRSLSNSRLARLTAIKVVP